MQVDFTKVFILLDENKTTEAKKYILSINFEDLSLEDKFTYLNTFGYVLCELKEFNQARKNYQRYLEMAIDTDNKENQHIAYHQFAMVERLDFNFTKAYQYIEKEIEIINKYFPNDVLKLAVNEYEKGYISFKLGNIEQAKLFMQASLKHALKTNDEVAKACAYRGLGKIYKEENPIKANENFDKAYKIFIDIGDEIGAKEVLELKWNPETN